MGVRSSGFKLLQGLMEVPSGTIYAFECPANEGANYVNRIRVELSGLRKLMKGMGKKIKSFKVIVVSIKQKEGDPSVHIVQLMRTDGQVVIAEGMMQMIAIMEQEGRSI